MLDLVQIVQQQILNIAGKCNGALVYVDSGIEEVLAVSDGVKLLFEAGALNVCQLYNASEQDALFGQICGPEIVSSLVILESGLLQDHHRAVFQSIKIHKNINKVQIFCTVTQEAQGQQAATMLGPEAYSEYKKLLLQDLKDIDRSGIQIDVEHVKLDVVPLLENAFVLPANSASVNLCVSGDLSGGYDSKLQDMGTVDDEGDTYKGGLSLLAYALKQTSDAANVRFQPFALGPASQYIGHELESLYPTIPSNISGAPEQAALILIDRSLDLLTPLLPSEHFLENFPKLKQNNKNSPNNQQQHLSGKRANFPPCTEISWDIPKLIETDKNNGFIPFNQQKQKVNSNNHFQQIFGLSKRDALMQIRKWLKDAAKQSQININNIKPSKGGQVSLEELEKLVQIIIDNDLNSAYKWFDVLGLATGAIQGQKLVQAESEEFLRESQWFLEQGGGESGRLDIIDRLDVCLGRLNGKLSFVEALKLVIIMISVLVSLMSGTYYDELLSDFEWADIRAKLIQIIIDSQGAYGEANITWLNEVKEQLQVAMNKSGEEKEYALTGVKLQLEDLFIEKLDTIQKLVLQKLSLQDINKIHSTKDETYSSMVGQIVEKILKGEEIRDLNKAQSSIGSLLQSGLDRLGFGGGGHQQQKKEQFQDFEKVFIFIVGGVCMREIREVAQLGQEYYGKNKQIVVGGTSLVDDVLVVNNLFK